MSNNNAKGQQPVLLNRARNPSEVGHHEIVYCQLSAVASVARDLVPTCRECGGGGSEGEQAQK